MRPTSPKPPENFWRCHARGSFGRSGRGWMSCVQFPGRAGPRSLFRWLWSSAYRGLNDEVQDVDHSESRCTMRIERIETFRPAEHPNLLWVRIDESGGLIGLGETYYFPAAVEAVIHDFAAPMLLGQSAFDRERHWQNLFCYANFFGYAGAEMALSPLWISRFGIYSDSIRASQFTICSAAGHATTSGSTTPALTRHCTAIKRGSSASRENSLGRCWTTASHR